MDSLMQNSAYFGFFITLMGYWCAVQVGKRMRSTLCNPLLLSRRRSWSFYYCIFETDQYQL